MISFEKNTNLFEQISSIYNKYDVADLIIYKDEPSNVYDLEIETLLKKIGSFKNDHEMCVFIKKQFESMSGTLVQMKTVQSLTKEIWQIIKK